MRCVGAETMDAERAFFGVLDELSRRAYSAPGMNDLGLGFNNLSDCAKGLSEMQQDVARSLKDEVVIPLDARLTADSRTAQVCFVCHCTCVTLNNRVAHPSADQPTLTRR
jgi:hypothetical protein